MKSIKQWIDNEIPAISDQLDKEIKSKNKYACRNEITTAGRSKIYKILDLMLSALFPGLYGAPPHSTEERPFFIANSLRESSLNLLKLSTCVIEEEKKLNHKEAEKKALDIIQSLMKKMPEIRKMLLKDIDSALKGDPSAKSLNEVLLSYPFVDAIATHRIAFILYNKGLPIIPRIMSERAHSRTGIDIHPGAQIEAGFFIDHGTGVVIGETCRIGKNVKIYQGVTLGALSPFDRDGNPLRGEKRHPDIEDDVIIYANATILGGKTIIGKGAVIGGNCFITKSIPANAMVYHKNEIHIR